MPEGPRKIIFESAPPPLVLIRRSGSATANDTANDHFSCADNDLICTEYNKEQIICLRKNVQSLLISRVFIFTTLGLVLISDWLLKSSVPVTTARVIWLCACVMYWLDRGSSHPRTQALPFNQRSNLHSKEQRLEVGEWGQVWICRSDWSEQVVWVLSGSELVWKIKHHSKHLNLYYSKTISLNWYLQLSLKVNVF